MKASEVLCFDGDGVSIDVPGEFFDRPLKSKELRLTNGRSVVLHMSIFSGGDGEIDFRHPMAIMVIDELEGRSYQLSRFVADSTPTSPPTAAPSPPPTPPNGPSEPV